MNTAISKDEERKTYVSVKDRRQISRLLLKELRQII